MPGRVRLLLAVAAAAFVAPATASAATFTVDQSAAAGCAGNVCKTIADAVAAVADGDTISVKATKTPYVEAAITITKKNVKIEAQPGGAIVTSSSTTAGAPVIRIGNGTAPAGEGTTLKNLFINGQKNGGPAVRVSALGATIDTTFLARATENTEDEAALQVDDDVAGTTTVKGSFVINAPTVTETQSAPAIQGGSTNTLVLQDTLVLSGAKQGPGLGLVGNDRTGADDTKPIANQIVRSTIYASEANADAVSLTSGAASTVNKSLVVDSSTLSGGQNGGGLLVTTEDDVLPGLSVAGDVTAKLVHTTIAGGTEGITIQADAAGAALPSSDPAGNVTVNVERSIVKGLITATNTGSTPLINAANTVKLDIKSSDANVTTKGTGATGEATISAAGNQNSTPEQLFADPAKEDFHLKLGSTAIDKAGPIGTGESDKDVDGDARLTGPATDIGADEFINRPPVPVINASKTIVATGETVAFDGSKSTDAEAASGGGIAKYVWRFGDGSADVETSAPTVTHAYAAPGTYTARLAVVDAQGIASTTVAAIVITVGSAGPAGTDGTPPVVTIAAPKANQVLKLFTVKTKTTTLASGKKRKTTTKKARTIKFSGTATDASGIGGVQIALRRVKLASAAATTCTFFDFTAVGFKSLNCAKPRYINVAVKDGAWAYKLKKGAFSKLKAGTYELFVRATDTTGTVSAPAKVTFTIKLK